MTQRFTQIGAGPSTSSTSLVDSSYIAARDPLGLVSDTRTRRRSVVAQRGFGSLSLAAELSASETVNRQAADSVVANVDAEYERIVHSVNMAASTPRTRRIAQVGNTLLQWRSTWRRWAELGRKPDGKPFSWEQWVINGKKLVDVAAAAAGVNWNSSALDQSFQPTGLGAAGSSLGLINVEFCSPFEDAIDTLGVALQRAEEAGATSSGVYQQAKEVYDTETGINIFERTKVWVGNCSSKTANIGGLISALNVVLSQKNIEPVIVPPQVKNTTIEENAPPKQTKPFEWSDITTPVTIGAIAVGIVAVAYMFGPLVRALSARAAPSRSVSGITRRRKAR